MARPTAKDFDAVRFMRSRRQILSDKLSKMTSAEIVKYFKKRRTESSVKPGA